MSSMHVAYPQFVKMLKNLNSWLTEGAESAKTREFDVQNLLVSRLAPDMFDLTRQVQSATDTAKLTAARLGNKQAPKHEDGEATLEELKARIESVLEFLGTFEASDFDGADERWIELPFAPGMRARGANYLNEFALPNFYFHVTLAYGILREAGVTLGKRAFIGSIDIEPVPSA